jgi:hypothetical protein
MGGVRPEADPLEPQGGQRWPGNRAALQTPSWKSALTDKLASACSLVELDTRDGWNQVLPAGRLSQRSQRSS